MRKKQRLYFILFMLASLSLAVAAGLYALRQNISLFRTPSDIQAAQVAPGAAFRLGGLVKEGTLQKRGSDLTVSFVVTDAKADQAVEYSGILPDLFREGQGVVATGALDARGVFVASELLAKHDENYMPPEVARGLKKAHEDGVKGLKDEQ